LISAIAGYFRDDAPWISEMLLDANRDLTDPLRSRKLVGYKKFREILSLIEKGSPVFRDVLDTKEYFFTLRELNRLIERELQNPNSYDRDESRAKAP
jgi:hypothetical protein